MSLLRRAILAIALAAVSSPAFAGESSIMAWIAPTPPTSDNNNRIATTAWVNNFIALGLPLASGKIYIGSAGNIATAQTMSGDATLAIGGALTLATVNANVGSFGSATNCVSFTTNAKGLITAASAVTCTPAIASITGLGTGVATWLATPSSANLRAAITDETGTGALYFQGGDIGTPSAGVGTNLTSLNASNLASGTVAAARGGAGTITGALKGNGAGVVSQAACADLSNATALCSQTPGTGVATALGNATNSNGGLPTDSAVQSWTPAVTASGTAGTPAYSVQVGSYEKIGSTVYAWFSIQLSNWTGSPAGNVSITGLPVSSGSTTNDYALCTVSDYSGVLSLGWLTGRISPGTTSALLLVVPQTGATAHTTFTAANAGTAFVIRGVCTYHT